MDFGNTDVEGLSCTHVILYLRWYITFEGPETRKNTFYNKGSIDGLILVGGFGFSPVLL